MKYNHDSMLPIGAFKPRGSVVGGRSMRLHGGDGMYIAPEEDERGVFVGGSGDSGGYWEAAPAPAPAPVYNEPAPAPVYNEPAPAPWSPPPEPAPAYNPPAPAAPAPAAPNWTQTINDIYQQEFGRQADPSGLASFTNLLNQGLTGEQMREALRASPEGQSRGLSPAPQGIASLPAATPAAYTPFDLKQYGYNTDLETQYYNAAKLANWQMEQGRPDVAQQYIQQANALKTQLDSPFRVDTITGGGGGDAGASVPETVLVDRSGNIVSSITAQDDGRYAVVAPGTGDAGLSTSGGEFTIDELIKQSTSAANTPFGAGRGQAVGYAYELKNEDGEPYQRYDANGNLTEFVNRLTGEWTKSSDVKPIGTVFDPTEGKFVTEYQYGDNKFTSTVGSGGSTFAPIMDPYSKDTGGFMGEGGWARAGALVAAGLTAGLASGALVPGSIAAAGPGSASALGLSAAKGALTSMAVSGIQGATPAQMLKAGVLGGLGAGLGDFIGAAELGTAGNIAAKAGVQTGLTAIAGGNVQNALISSLINSTLPVVLNEALPPETSKILSDLPKPVQTVIMSTAGSVLNAGVTGKDISDAAVGGVTNGLINLGKDFAKGAFKDLSESELAQTVKNYLNPSYEEFQALPQDANATLDDVIRALPKTPTTSTTASAKDPYSVENIMANIEAGYQKDIKPIEGSETAGLGSFITDKVKQYFNLSDPQTQEEVNDFFESVLKQVGESPQVQSAAGNLDVLGNIPAGISGLFSYGIMRPEGADVAQQFKEADFEKYGSPVAKLFNIPMDESSAYAQSSGQQIMQAIGSGIKWLGGVAEEKLGIPSTDVETLVEAFGPKVVGKTLSTAANLKGPALESFKDNLSKWSADYQNAREGVINLDPNLGSVSGEFINKVVGQKETPIIQKDSSGVVPETKPESGPPSLLEYAPEKPTTPTKDVSALFDEVFANIENTPTYDVPPVAKTDTQITPKTDKAFESTTTFPDARETLTPEKSEYLREIISESDGGIKPNYTGDTLIDTPISSGSKPQLTTDPSVVSTAFAEPIKPINLGLDAETPLMQYFKDEMSTSEAANLARDFVTQKTVADLAESTGKSDAEVKKLIEASKTETTKIVSDLDSKIAANEEAGMERGAATDKAIEELAEATGKSDEEIKKLVADSQSVTEKLVSNIDAKIAANEKAGMSRDAATDKAIADLSKSTGTSVAELKGLISSSTQASQQYTQTQIAGLQTTLSQQIAANEKSGMSRDAATDKAIADLAKQTNLSDIALKNLISSTAQSGQQYTQQQVANLQSTLSQQIAANEKSGLTRDQATDKAIADLAKSTGTSVSDLKNAIAGVNANVASSVSGLKSNLEALITANETAGLSRDQATQNAINSLAASTGTSVSDLKNLISTTQAELAGAIGSSAQAGQQYTQAQVANLQSTLSKQIAANEAAGMTRANATDQAINDLARQTSMSDTELRNLIGTSAQAGQQYTQAQIAGLQNTLSQQMAVNEATGMSRDQALSTAISSVAASLGTSTATLMGLIGEATGSLGSQIAGIGGGLSDLSSSFEAYQKEQEEKQAAAEKLQQQKQAAAAKQRARDQLISAMSQTQQVSAKTPPGAEIDYLYDIGGESIFAPMRTKSKYEPREDYYDPKVERQYADGGLIENGSIEDLYALLRSI